MAYKGQVYIRTELEARMAVTNLGLMQSGGHSWPKIVIIGRENHFPEGWGLFMIDRDLFMVEEGGQAFKRTISTMFCDQYTHILPYVCCLFCCCYKCLWNYVYVLQLFWLHLRRVSAIIAAFLFLVQLSIPFVLAHLIRECCPKYVAYFLFGQHRLA